MTRREEQIERNWEDEIKNWEDAISNGTISLSTLFDETDECYSDN